MANNNTASNYNGKTGKANVVQQGQTRGEYGSDTQMKRRVPCPPSDLKP